MQRLLSILAVLSWLSLAVANVLPAAAQADEVGSDQDTICTATHAEWRNYYTVDGEPAHGPLHGVDRPDGTYTSIFSCKFGTHYLRVNYMSLPYSQRHCEAAEQGYVSAWIDGVQVISREVFTNDRDVCQRGFSSNDSTPPTPVPLISKILVNTQLHLTLCYNTHDVETGMPGKETCTLTPLDLKGKGRDPVYAGPLKRTRPGYDLIASTSPLCGLFPADDTALEDNARFQNKDIPLIDYSTLTDEQKNNPYPQTFHVDVDNNGIKDDLTYTINYYDTEQDMPAASYDWKSGKDGRSHSIDEALEASGTITETGPNARVVRMFRIQDHNYVFLAQGSFLGSGRLECYVLGECPDMGAEDDDHLYAIGQDGDARELCKWRPRTRPEERL